MLGRWKRRAWQESRSGFQATNARLDKERELERDRLAVLQSVELKKLEVEALRLTWEVKKADLAMSLAAKGN